MSFKFFNNSGQELAVNSVADLPIGAIVVTAGSSVPNGWLACDGSAVSRADYADLFGALGTFYGAGNGTTTFNLPDISGSIIYALTNSRRILSTSPPQFVSTLPTSPISGQEIYYQASGVMAASGITWHLRYNASSSSIYKWEFVGGTSIATYGATTNRTTTSTSYAALSGEAIEVTVPLAGDYRIEHGFAKAYLNAAGYFEQTVKLGSADASAANGLLIENANNTWTSGSLSLVATDLAASSVLALQHQVNTGTVNFQRRWLTAVPVRVGYAL